MENQSMFTGQKGDGEVVSKELSEAITKKLGENGIRKELNKENVITDCIVDDSFTTMSVLIHVLKIETEKIAISFVESITKLEDQILLNGDGSIENGNITGIIPLIEKNSKLNYSDIFNNLSKHITIYQGNDIRVVKGEVKNIKTKGLMGETKRECRYDRYDISMKYKIEI